MSDSGRNLFKNKNKIITTGFSNPASEKRFKRRWSDEPEVAKLCLTGRQCGGCSFYAVFNKDWGLCCNKKSRHYLETVFEHFTCPSHVNESWAYHTFSETPERLEPIMDFRTPHGWKDLKRKK